MLAHIKPCEVSLARNAPWMCPLKRPLRQCNCHVNCLSSCSRGVNASGLAGDNAGSKEMVQHAGECGLQGDADDAAPGRHAQSPCRGGTTSGRPPEQPAAARARSAPSQSPPRSIWNSLPEPSAARDIQYSMISPRPIPFSRRPASPRPCMGWHYCRRPQSATVCTPCWLNALLATSQG